MDTPQSGYGSGLSNTVEGLEFLQVISKFHSTLTFDNSGDWNNCSFQLTGLFDVLFSGPPFLGFFEFTGNKISLDWYSFNLWTLRCRDSKDLFLRRWSTLIPVVRAIFLVIPAPFNSSRVNP